MKVWSISDLISYLQSLEMQYGDSTVVLVNPCNIVEPLTDKNLPLIYNSDDYQLEIYTE